jgi:hypothetical protein
MSEQKINVTLTTGPDEGAMIVRGAVAVAVADPSCRSIRGIMRAVTATERYEGAYLTSVRIDVDGYPPTHYALAITVYDAESLGFGSADNVIPSVPVRDETVQGIVDATIKQAVELARFNGGLRLK